MGIKNSEVFTADLHKVVDGKETVVSQWRFYIRIEPYFVPLHTMPSNGWYKYYKKHVSEVKRIPNTYFVPGVPSESGLILTNVQHFDFGRTKRKSHSLGKLHTWEKVNAIVKYSEAKHQYDFTAQMLGTEIHLEESAPIEIDEERDNFAEICKDDTFRLEK